MLSYFALCDMQMVVAIFMDVESGVASISELGALAIDFIAHISANHKTYVNGFLHSLFTSIMLVPPIISTSAMSEC